MGTTEFLISLVISLAWWECYNVWQVFTVSFFLHIHSDCYMQGGPLYIHSNPNKINLALDKRLVISYLEGGVQNGKIAGRNFSQSPP